MTESAASGEEQSHATDAIVRLAQIAGQLHRRLRRLTLQLAAVLGIAAVLALTGFRGTGLGAAVVVLVVLVAPVILLYDLSRRLGDVANLSGNARDAYAEALDGARRVGASVASGAVTDKTRLVRLIRDVSGLVLSTKERLGAGRLLRLTNPAYLTSVGLALVTIPLIVIASILLAIAALVS